MPETRLAAHQLIESTDVAMIRKATPAATPGVNWLTRQLTRTVPADGRSSTPNIVGKGTNTGATSRVTLWLCTTVVPDSIKPCTERLPLPSTVPPAISEYLPAGKASATI